MLAKLVMVRLCLPKLESLYELHVRYFHCQRNIFNATEVRRSQHLDKPLNYKLVYTNETNDNLRLESQKFVNSRVTLAQRNMPIMLMGSPKSRKRQGDGVFIVAAKIKLYTTTVTCGEGEEKQSVSCKSLDRSNKRRDLNKCNNINVYENLLNSDFL